MFGVAGHGAELVDGDGTMSRRAALGESSRGTAIEGVGVVLGGSNVCKPSVERAVSPWPNGGALSARADRVSSAIDDISKNIKQ